MAGGNNLKLKGKIEEFYKELIPVLQKYPKTQRYTLAENIEKETLNCVRKLFDAEYNKSRRVESLTELRTSLHIITFLLRISIQSKFITENTYEQFVRKTSEIGKITSGWIKTEVRSSESKMPSVSVMPEQQALL